MLRHYFRPLLTGRPLARVATIAVTSMLALPVLAGPIFSLTPLVTDDSDFLESQGFPAVRTVDPNLINPWGISLTEGGPFWVSNQGTNTSTLYTGEGEPFPPGIRSS